MEAQSMDNSVNTNGYAGFASKTYGGLDAWEAFVLPHPRLGKIRGKTFLGSELGLTGMEVSLTSLAPGKAIPYLHAHRQNEELYLFLSGQGQMLLDGQVVEVTAGTAIRVAPAVMRAWRNTGTVPLCCVCIQAKEGSLVQATMADGFLADSAPVWPTG
jgi:uncharacterized cupin superfamily protein